MHINKWQHFLGCNGQWLQGMTNENHLWILFNKSEAQRNKSDEIFTQEIIQNQSYIKRSASCGLTPSATQHGRIEWMNTNRKWAKNFINHENHHRCSKKKKNQNYTHQINKRIERRSQTLIAYIQPHTVSLLDPGIENSNVSTNEWMSSDGVLILF